MSTGLCAVLLAEACNVRLTSVARTDVPALTRGRLAQVDHCYLGVESIPAANVIASVVEGPETGEADSDAGAEVSLGDVYEYVQDSMTCCAHPCPGWGGWPPAGPLSDTACASRCW